MGPDEELSLRLRLYVNGDSAQAGTVAHNLRMLCDDAEVEYELEVLEVVEHAQAAEDDRVMLTPTLIRLSPAPRLRVAGDLSDARAALDGLGLRFWQRGRDTAEPGS